MLPVIGAAIRRSRDRAVVDELPEALDRLAADLRGGATVLGGLVTLAAEPGPLAAELRLVTSAAADGSITEALRSWPAGRHEIAVVAGALEVADAVGGRCAAALEGLAAGLRSRGGLRDEIRALSAQARLSALVVGLAPLAAVGLSVAVDPRVLGALTGSPAGRACLLAGGGLQILAALWIRRILRVPDPGPADGLALLSDLLAMALASGLTPFLALDVAVRSGPPATTAPLGAVVGAVAGGGRLADALEAGSAAHPPLRPLLTALLTSERFGAPVAPALARMAAAARDRARQAGLARARTIPVRLLFPLVFLVLPAFVLLTVAPVLLAGLSGGPSPWEV